MKIKFIQYVLILLITGCSFISCEKPPEEEDPRILQEGDYKVHTGKSLEAVLDSIYLYAQQIYLWNEFLPTIEKFNPSQYAVNMQEKPNEAIQNLLIGLASHTSGDDNWSHVEKNGKSIAGLTSNGTLATNKGTIDFKTLSVHPTGLVCAILNGRKCVIGVYPASPAEKAGVKRGDILTSEPTTALGIYTYSIIRQNATKTLWAIGGGNFQLSKNVVITNTLSVESEDKTVKKVGYLFFREFDSDEFSKETVKSAITKFRNEEVTELVIDLRYNAGGFLSYADWLLTSIVRSGGMFLSYMKYNCTIEKGEAILLQNQLPTGGGTPLYYELLDESLINYGRIRQSYYSELPKVQNIYIIVSAMTASASEYLIHCLKPLLAKDQRLFVVGKQTHRKAVGAFPIQIGDYDVHLINFIYLDINQHKLPATAINPDYNCADDLDHELGDPEEACFAATIKHMKSANWPSKTDLKPPVNLGGGI